MQLKCKLLCLLCSLGSMPLLQAQATCDSSYLTTYYEQKVSMFRLLPDTKGEIIFLGNSITDIGEWAEIWNNIQVKNRGISSDNTFGVLARLDEVLSSRPAKLFIMIGINDIAKNIPDTVILKNYQKIIDRVAKESPTTKLFVQSILPVNKAFTDFKNHQNKDEHIVWVNGQLQTYCNEKGIRFVNLYPHFLEENSQLSKQYSNDGLHLNGAGFMNWKSILIQEKLMK